MVGQERSLLSLLATQVFGLAAVSAALTYIVGFGLTKAATNLLAGTACDRYGRKPVLVAGWLLGLPVPLLLIWAPTWTWVVAANVLLGVNQGLCWSTTVIMKIDLAGPRRRGLAMGLNEAAGYLAVALTAYLTGLIAARAGLRPEPFYLGLAYAGLGLGLSALLVRETRAHAHLEAQLADADRPTGGNPGRNPSRVVAGGGAAVDPRGAGAYQPPRAGPVGLQPGRAGQQPQRRARLGPAAAAVCPRRPLGRPGWPARRPLPGRLGPRPTPHRPPLGPAGPQAPHHRRHAAPGGRAGRHRPGGPFLPWAASAILLGAGTAMVYPTLLAAISDVAHPSWRASAVGVYRLWRDTGFAVGALLAGLVADLAGLVAAVWVVAALTAASGLVVAVRMYETHPPAART